MNSQFSILNSQFFRFILIALFIFTSFIVGTSFTVNAQNPEPYVDSDLKTSGTESDLRTSGTESDLRTSGTESDLRTSGTSDIFTLQNPLKVNSIGELLQSFIQIFTYLVIIFAVLMFIWIGFQYVVNAAQGNAKKIEELHKQLMWLVVGVAIVIGARVIIEIVINTLSATGAVSPGVIDSANRAVQGK